MNNYNCSTSHLLCSRICQAL